MAEELKALYLKQEQERHRLRVRHRVELDKLMILYEQEMLRCYNRIFREEFYANPKLFADSIGHMRDDTI